MVGSCADQKAGKYNFKHQLTLTQLPAMLYIAQIESSLYQHFHHTHWTKFQAKKAFKD